jgi:hypothetical protein
MQPRTGMSDVSKMPAMIAAFDWAGTPLGRREQWPKSLNAVVEVILRQPLAMIVLWGPQFIQIYNDGYAQFAAGKHPAALGRPAFEVWPEVTCFTQPLYARVMRGESIAVKDQLLMLRRHGAEVDEAFI